METFQAIDGAKRKQPRVELLAPSERVSIYRRWRFHGKTVAALAYEYGVRLFVIDEVIRQQTAAVENDVRLEAHRAGRLSVSPPNWPSPAKAA